MIIPIEILELIFQFLDIRKCMGFKCVSKVIMNMINNNFIARTIKIHYGGDIIIHDQIDDIIRWLTEPQYYDLIVEEFSNGNLYTNDHVNGYMLLDRYGQIVKNFRYIDDYKVIDDYMYDNFVDDAGDFLCYDKNGKLFDKGNLSDYKIKITPEHKLYKMKSGTIVEHLSNELFELKKISDKYYLSNVSKYGIGHINLYDIELNNVMFDGRFIGTIGGGLIYLKESTHVFYNPKPDEYFKFSGESKIESDEKKYILEITSSNIIKLYCAIDGTITWLFEIGIHDLECQKYYSKYFNGIAVTQNENFIFLSTRDGYIIKFTITGKFIKYTKVCAKIDKIKMLKSGRLLYFSDDARVILSIL